MFEDPNDRITVAKELQGFVRSLLTIARRQLADIELEQGKRVLTMSESRRKRNWAGTSVYFLSHGPHRYPRTTRLDKGGYPLTAPTRA